MLAPGQPTALLPDHKQLPDKDGSIVTNYQEHPQSNLLTECLRPRLRELYPGGQFSIGCDSGIYYRFTQPPLDGCKAPDWFLVPNVPPMLEGEFRRSYVLWQEVVKPLLIIEYVSGDGSEERDTTPYKGKFWVYEQGICAGFYAIFEAARAAVEVYRLDAGRYRPVPANAAGRFPIEPLGVELGIWEGEYREIRGPWLRVWDSATGTMLSLAEERAEIAEGVLDDTRQLLNEATERAEAERQRAEAEAQRAEAQRQRAEAAEGRVQTAQEQARKLAEKLRALGIDPEA
jgi:Uma2 family endonuclease